MGTRSRPRHPKVRRHFRHAQFLVSNFERYLENMVRHCANPQMLHRVCSWLRSHKAPKVNAKKAIASTAGLDQSWAMSHPLALRSKLLGIAPRPGKSSVRAQKASRGDWPSALNESQQRWSVSIQDCFEKQAVQKEVGHPAQ